MATGDEEEVPDALQDQIPLIEAALVGLGVPPVGVPGMRRTTSSGRMRNSRRQWRRRRDRRSGPVPTRR